MCELCKNSVARDYTHAKNKHHLRLLMKKIKVKLESGYYIRTREILTTHPV